MTHTDTDELWGENEFSALWIIAFKLNLAQHDNGADILHGQMFVETWILRPYGMSEAAPAAPLPLGRLPAPFCRTDSAMSTLALTQI